MSTNTTKTSARKTSASAKTTARSAGTTAKSAKGTARSAAATTRSAATTTRSATSRAAGTTRRQVRATEQGVLVHGRRVVGAAQAEVAAVASQPTRPLFFTLGVVDRAAAGVKALPSTVINVPTRTRQRLVSVAASAGDLAERAQRGYTDVAVDGEKLVRAVRRQESTQEAVKYAERAQTRGQRAVRDTEKAVDAAADAAVQAVSKLG